MNAEQLGNVEYVAPSTSSVTRERMRYGVGLVFHGERSRPYGFVTFDQPRA